MSELKTEPGFPLPRARRPWWAAALVGGLGAGAAIAAALGLSTASAVRGEPALRTSAIVPVGQTDAEWRAHIDAKLTELGERLARIEGRLDRGR